MPQKINLHYMKKIVLLVLSLTSLTSLSYGQTCIGLTGGLNLSKATIDERTEMLFTGANSFDVNRTANGFYGFSLSNGLGTRGRLNLQAGFNVITKGYATKAVYEDPGLGIRLTTERRYAIKNFEIPVTFRLVLGKPNVGIDPYLVGGGYLGIVRKAHVNYKDTQEDLNNGTSTTSENDSDHKPFNADDLSSNNAFANGLFLTDYKDWGYVYGGGFAFNLGGAAGGPKFFIEAKASSSFKSRSVFVDMNGNPSDPKVRNKVFYLSAGLMFPIFVQEKDRLDD